MTQAPGDHSHSLILCVSVIIVKKINDCTGTVNFLKVREESKTRGIIFSTVCFNLSLKYYVVVWQLCQDNPLDIQEMFL